MTVQQLGQNMTAAEESVWVQLYRDEPFGYTRTDAALAQIAQLLFNINAPKKDHKPIGDFMLFKSKEKQQLDENKLIRQKFDLLIEGQKK